MKTERNIFIAFILNLTFSVFEFFGGIFTGSVAIVSDSVHDMGDALSIGIAFLLERKSKKQPDKKFTYGYARYSVLGSIITTLILLIGSSAVIYNAIIRILEPKEINYNGMIIFALVGVTVNLLAAFITREKGSLNQKAVNLHMLEDVLGWVVVLVGSVVMRFTDFYIIDSIMSICLSVFILVNAVKNLKAATDLLLEKAPCEIKAGEIKEHICKINGVLEVHHIHIWTMDGESNYATMHVVTREGSDLPLIKRDIRQELSEHGINHSTLEFEKENEDCQDKICVVKHKATTHHHHHHHH